MLSRFFGWVIWRVCLAIYGPPPGTQPTQPIILRNIDDATADWVFEEHYATYEAAWLCPRCNYPSFAESGVLWQGTRPVRYQNQLRRLQALGGPCEDESKPVACFRCGWFKPGPLDLLAREAQ
jgi:hypothetical protein